MDPNENIKRQLALANRMGIVDPSQPPLIADATELAELVLALDGWRRDDETGAYQLAGMGEHA